MVYTQFCTQICTYGASCVLNFTVHELSAEPLSSFIPWLVSPHHASGTVQQIQICKNAKKNANFMAYKPFSQKRKQWVETIRMWYDSLVKTLNEVWHAHYVKLWKCVLMKITENKMVLHIIHLKTIDNTLYMI